MPHILNIETATKVCSVALSYGGKVIAYRENLEEIIAGSDKYSHAELLAIYIKETLDESGIKPEQLDAVAVSQGPGSYTGLRIGVASAKGLCYALGIPLIAVDTLKSMANLIKDTTHVALLAERNPNLLLCPMIDARRMEVYAAFYDMSLNEYRTTQADIIDENSYKEITAERPVFFFGDGMAKCKTVLASRPNTYFVDEFFPSARGMFKLAQELYKEKTFADTAYFEPFYLKEFQATVAKKLV